MEITVREKDEITIFDIQGRIISIYTLELKNLIDDSIALALKTGKKIKILLNFAKVSLIDSHGLKVVIVAYMFTQSKGGKIALLNLGKSNRQIIVNRKLQTIFETYEDEAIASFS